MPTQKEKDLFIRAASIDWSIIPETSYLRAIPALSGRSRSDLFVNPAGSAKPLTQLTFHKPITFFVGENGTGKSTLLEALALSLGFNAEGGTKYYNFSTYDSHSDLYRAMRLSRGVHMPKYGYFLRAESFYNVATKEMDYADPGHPSLRLHEKSHGEGFLATIQRYFHGNGVYLMDEPEAAFSPQRQLVLLSEIHRCAEKGAQFIIVTHSPILLGIPNSEILTFDEGLIHPCEYEDTSSYIVTLGFMTHKKQMLKELLKADDEEEN